MAYREFRNEATYKAPEIGALMPQTMGVLDTAMKIKAQKGASQGQRMGEFGKVDKTGYWVKNTNDIINDSQKLTNILTYARMNGMSAIPPEAEQLKQNIDAKRERGKVLKETADRVKSTIAQMQNDDPYFKPDVLNQKLIQLNNPDLELNDIEGILGEVSQMANSKANTFNEAKYLKDFVDEAGEIQTGTDIKTKEGIQQSSEYKGKFFNKKGVPEITDEHIQSVIERNHNAKQYYQELVTNDISKELDQILAGRINDIPSNEKGNTLKAMIAMGNDDEAVNFLRENPEINPINKKTEFERISERVKPALKEREDVLIKSKSDYSNKLPNSSYGSGNPNYLEGSGSFKGGGVFTTYKKAGQGDAKLPQFSVNRVNGVNANTGQPVKGGSGEVWGAVQNYKVGPVVNGMPLMTQATDINALEQELRALPLIDRLRMNAQPILNVKIIDKGNILDIAYNQGELGKLEKQARDNPDSEIARELPSIKEQLSLMEAGEPFDSQMLQSFFGKDIVSNELIPVNKNDINKGGYQAETGIDVTSPKAMTPEMKETQKLIEKIKKEAQIENNRYQIIESNKAVNAANEKELSKVTQRKTATKQTTTKAKSIADLKNEGYEFPEGKIIFIKPDGTPVAISPDQKQKAIDKGYKLIN